MNPDFKRGRFRFVAMGRFYRKPSSGLWRDLFENVSPLENELRPLKFFPPAASLRLCNPGEAATQLKGEITAPTSFHSLRQHSPGVARKVLCNIMQRDLPFWEGIVGLREIMFYRLNPDGEMVPQSNFNNGYYEFPSSESGKSKYTYPRESRRFLYT